LQTTILPAPECRIFQWRGPNHLADDAGKTKKFSGQIEIGKLLAEPKQVEADPRHEMEEKAPGEKRLGRDRNAPENIWTVKPLAAAAYSPATSRPSGQRPARR
jgi:hypothetical protein